MHEDKETNYDFLFESPRRGKGRKKKKKGKGGGLAPAGCISTPRCCAFLTAEEEEGERGGERGGKKSSTCPSLKKISEKLIEAAE